MRSGKGKGAGGPGCTHGGGHRRPLRRPPARKMSPWLWGATCANPRWTQCRGMPEACLRAGGNAGRPGQSSGAFFHYDYTARRFFLHGSPPKQAAPQQKGAAAGPRRGRWQLLSAENRCPAQASAATPRLCCAVLAPSVCTTSPTAAGGARGTGRLAPQRWRRVYKNFHPFQWAIIPPIGAKI